MQCSGTMRAASPFRLYPNYDVMLRIYSFALCGVDVATSIVFYEAIKRRAYLSSHRLHTASADWADVHYKLPFVELIYPAKEDFRVAHHQANHSHILPLYRARI